MATLGSSHQFFSVSEVQSGGAAHLHLSGELDIATSAALNGCLSGAERVGTTGTVVDLQDVTFMDASALHAFLRAWDRAERSGRGFSIINAPTAVRSVLDITGTTQLLGCGLPTG